MLVEGKIFNYVLYKHPDADKEKLPLIVFLHGAGERGSTLEDLPRVQVHGVPKLLKEGHPLRCVAVSPQCPVGKYWATEIPSVLAFIKEMIATYGVDEDRVSLTGLSMGGFGTWSAATAEPRLFSCIAPVCGGGMPWAAGAITMPVRAFHGDKDTVVLPSCSIDMMDVVQRSNPDALLTLYHNVGHNSWEWAYTMELLTWMISQKRQDTE